MPSLHSSRTAPASRGRVFVLLLSLICPLLPGVGLPGVGLPGVGLAAESEAQDNGAVAAPAGTRTPTAKNSPAGRPETFRPAPQSQQTQVPLAEPAEAPAGNEPGGPAALGSEYRQAGPQPPHG